MDPNWQNYLEYLDSKFQGFIYLFIYLFYQFCDVGEVAIINKVI